MTNSLPAESKSWDPSWIAALVRRAENEGAPFALNLVQAAYGAEERGYADRFAAALKVAHVEMGQVLLHVMNFMPSPQADTNIESLLPIEGQALAAAQSAQLPNRDFDHRLDFRLLSALGGERLGAWLVSESGLSHGVPLLRIASLVAPEVASAAVASAGIGELRELLVGASVDAVLDVMDAVREANIEAAVELQARLGDQYLLNQAVAPPDGCLAIQVNGPVVRGRFLAEADEDARERAVRLTTRLYRLFLRATESEMVGLLDVGVEALFAHLQIPRGNLAPSSWRITANQFWLSLCTERLGGSSVAAVVHQQLEYIRNLLDAMREIHSALPGSSTSRVRTPLRLWAETDERARNIPYVPRITPPVVTVVEEGGEVPYALPGSQPIDHAFAEIKQSASNAHRELSAFLDTRRCNRAILIHQLGELERATSTYEQLVAQFVPERDVDLLGDLEHVSRRLRKNLQLLTDNALPRDDRRLANESFDRFSALRMLTADVIRRIGAADEQFDPSAARDSAAVALALSDLNPIMGQWPDYRALVPLASEINDALVAPDNQAIRDSVAEWEADIRRLASATALDLEAWWYEARKREWLNALIEAFKSRLAEQGMEADCVPLDEGLDEFLLVIVVIIARIPDMAKSREFMAAVEDTAFAILPEQVRELVLLTINESGNVLPRGFRRLRDSTPLPQEPALNPFAPWYPVDDVAEYANEVGRELARAEHPVAQLLGELDHGIQRLALAFGHFGVLAVTVAEGGWEVGVEPSSRVVQRLSDELANIQRCANSVCEVMPVGGGWESVVAHSLRSATHYLALMLRATAGQADPNEVEAVRTELEQARNAVMNTLYLSVASTPAGEATIHELCSEFEQVSGQFAGVVDQMRSEFEAALRGQARVDQGRQEETET